LRNERRNGRIEENEEVGIHPNNVNERSAQHAR